MKKIGKILLPVLFLLFISGDAIAQIGWDSLAIKKNNRLFWSLAYSFVPDFEQSPYKVNPNYEAQNYNASSAATTIIWVGNLGMRQFTTNFESAGIKCRYNIAEFSAIASLSVSCNPTIGAGFSLLEQSPPIIGGGVTGYGSINIPLFLEFNYGGGATQSTREEYGIFACAGVEFTQAPVIHTTIPAQVMMDAGGNDYIMRLVNYWFEPAVGLGVRYHNRKNKLREIYLKYGMGATNIFIGAPGYYPVSGFPWTLKLTFAGSGR